MPLIATRGAASAQGFGEFAQSRPPIYIDDVFSTWLYTGTGSSQTINNGIDLAGKGGLVWLKSRSGDGNHRLVDTARGFVSPGGDAFMLSTSNSNGQASLGAFDSFNSNGFSISGTDPTVNASGITYASWTFREEPKFFDVVTYTGNGSNRTIAHNLGSVPGCIIVKRTDTADDWQVYHRSLANTQYMVLNTTAAVATGATRWDSTTPTSTVFSLGTNATVNANGGTYVAYLFAHNAGGFGATGNDNVISCGSFTTPSSGFAQISVGYEPQWILLKATNASQDWILLDGMRGIALSATATLVPNSVGSESILNTNSYALTATGFEINSAALGTSREFIYIAIRRPHKPPTSGTQVFSTFTALNAGSPRTITTGFPVDLNIAVLRDELSGRSVVDRLRGGTPRNRDLSAQSNAAETSRSDSTTGISFDSNTGVVDRNWYSNATSFTPVWWNFRRAPGFFDVVCYTGTGVARTVAHNLGVAPELIIVKQRNTAQDWLVYAAPLGNNKALYLNFTDASTTRTEWNNTTPTSSVFSVSTNVSVNQSGGTYVAYLFASAAGISKVGSYTGNGTSQTINCGFAAGARFVMIKRTDNTGNWFVWDSARGINPAGTNDPYLVLNTTAAEVTTNDSLSAQSVGFGVIQNATTDINVNAASYIFLAIA